MVDAKSQANQPTEVHKWLSRAGFMSRSDAEAAVADGRVLIAGEVARSPQSLVKPGALVMVDGRNVETLSRLVLAVHKPRGVMTTHRDPQGRPTVYDLLDKTLPWLAPVGRLDFDSEGLILMTNDPQLGAALTDPNRGVEKTYLVTAKGRVDDEALEALATGILLRGEMVVTRPVLLKLIRRSKDRTLIEMVLHEGKKRQIRRMLSAVGSRVRRLIRVRIGPITLGDLAVGATRALTDQEVTELATSARLVLAKR